MRVSDSYIIQSDKLIERGDWFIAIYSDTDKQLRQCKDGENWNKAYRSSCKNNGEDGCCKVYHKIHPIKELEL